jgi:uncharacterized protein (TIGR02646 family)
MLKITLKPLSAKSSTHLAKTQRDIDTLPTFEAQVAHAHQYWGSRTKNQAFQEIRNILAQGSGHRKRCFYCEDNLSTDIEHFRPKSLYPDYAFVWDNYLYACTPCNRPKSNQFAVFEPRKHTYTDINTSSPLPPPHGIPVLLNPRIDDPLDFLELDLFGTFKFNLRPKLRPRDQQRAEYTLNLFALNTRDELLAARRTEFQNCLNALESYRSAKQKQAPSTQLATIISPIHNMTHPTVWAEIKRQYPNLKKIQPQFMPDHLRTLLDLLAQIPEALSW